MTRQTARRKAEANGHILDNFKARMYSPNFGATRNKMYDVAHCRECGAACFANESPRSSDVNPALSEKCTGRQVKANEQLARTTTQQNNEGE